MTPHRHRLVVGPALAVAASFALALAGCSKSRDEAGNTTAAALPALPATLPMTDAPAAASVALAPPPTAMPARPIRTVRLARPRDAYAYADQAGYFSRSLGDGPPDYGFDYDGVRPWAWQADDGSRVFVEPVEGGYRYYYYRAGADEPYFVRDPRYAYGYDDGQLAVIYDADGAVVPYAGYGPLAGYAGAFLWRGARLFDASRDRQAISALAWADRQASIAASRERWAANRDRQAEWAAYHAEEAAQESRYWAGEAARRDADAQRFDAWQQQDFRSPPPPRAIPPRWQQAGWAQNGARYVPVAAAVGGAAIGAVALSRHAATRQDAAPQPLAAPGRPPVPAVAPGAGPDGDGHGSRPGSPVRPPAPALHAAARAFPSVGRPQQAPADRGMTVGPAQAVHRQPVGPAAAPRRRAAPDRQGPVPGHPNTPPAERAVTVHHAPGPDDRSPPVTPRGGGRSEEAPHGQAPRPPAVKAAPTRPSPAAPRPAAPPPHANPVAARPAGGGNHSGGGRPAGGGHDRRP